MRVRVCMCVCVCVCVCMFVCVCLFLFICVFFLQFKANKSLFFLSKLPKDWDTYDVNYMSLLPYCHYLQINSLAILKKKK